MKCAMTMRVERRTRQDRPRACEPTGDHVVNDHG